MSRAYVEIALSGGCDIGANYHPWGTKVLLRAE